MEPRLKTSKKWSALPKELMQQIRTVFGSTFKEQLKGAKIEADGRIYPEEILIQVGFKESQALKQSNFMISIAYKKDKDNVLKLLHLGTDAMGALFDTLFSSEDDSELPRTWAELEFEGRVIHVQYTTNNTELESQANKLLGIGDDESLAGGDWEDENDAVTPESIKAKLGIDDDDDEEDGGGRSDA